MLTGRTIGKRYARTDEIGVSFAVTVDSTTSVTIRERDSKDQVRVDVEKVANVIREVTEGQRTWEDVWFTFHHHSSTVPPRPEIQDLSAKIALLIKLASKGLVGAQDIIDLSAKIDLLIKPASKGLVGAQYIIEIKYDKRLDEDKI